MAARLTLWHRLRGEAPPDADVDILLSERAWKTFQGLQRTDAPRAKIVWTSLDKLYDLKFWPPENPNSSLKVRRLEKDSDGRWVYKFRAEHNHIRGFFRFEKSREGEYLPQVLIDDFSLDHSEELRVANAVLGRTLSSEQLAAADNAQLQALFEPDSRSAGPPSGRPGTRYRPRLNVPYEDVENALNWAYSSVNILPTPDQVESIASPAPIVINGQAGTGKTSMLAIRAGFASQFSRQARTDAKMLCTAYSRLVVGVLKTGVKEFLIYKLREPAGPEEDGVCTFRTFAEVLIQQLDDSQMAFYSRRERRVAFGRFNREFFQPRKTHRTIGAEVSAEFVWYAIRCFFKGYLEDDTPPTIEDFSRGDRGRGIPRRLTRDLSPDAIRAAAEVFRQYEVWLKDQGFFDDIDLARAAWKRVRAKPPREFDEIYLDEAQDLTRVDFLVLRELLKPGTGSRAEQARIVLAGDPQQTIHPTGFNWKGIKAFFWKGDELKQTDLRVNHRTPQPIVDFANAIQRRRHHYGMEDLVEQEARTQVGLKPICYQIESPKDDPTVMELLKSPRPGTAIIVWAEDDDEVIELLKFDKHINGVAREVLGDAKVEKLVSGEFDPGDLDGLMAAMRLHSVSEVKGLEFERVVLYKLGSNPAFAKFARYTTADLPIADEFEARIPILYHLNRLYVAITRSTRHLFIIDKPDAVASVWSHFSEVDQSRVHQLHGLPTDPALSSDEHLDWTATGRQYLELWEEEHVARWLVHALTCFERAPDDVEAQSLLVKTKAELKVQDALMAEVKGATSASRAKWKEAGDLWDQNPVYYQRAAQCYVKAEAWEDVERVLGASPRLSPQLEGWYLYSRLRIHSVGEERASAHAYLDYLGRNKELPRDDEWIEALSRRLLKLKDVDGLIKLHGEICWSGSRGETQHPSTLVEALASLDRPDAIVRFVQRHELQRQLWKPYSEAMRKLARQAEAREDWAGAGGLWKSIAQQSPDQGAKVQEYVLAAIAFARASLAGSPQYWPDAASCYGEAGPAYARQRGISEAEAAAMTGAFVPGIKTLASTLGRDWIAIDPLKDVYTDDFCSERLLEWATKANPQTLASDWDGLTTAVDAHVSLRKRSEAKTWLRNLAMKVGGHGNLAFRLLASMEEDDQEYLEAALDYERADEFEKAWSLTRKLGKTLGPTDLLRLEGKFLAWRYERQKEPSRADADRAVELLTRAGENAKAKEVAALRLSRETDPLGRVQLVLEKGVDPDSFMIALRLQTTTESAEKSRGARAFLLEILAKTPAVRDRSPGEVRAVTMNWLSDSELQCTLRDRLSPEEYGYAVMFGSDDLHAKEFFQVEAGLHGWARAPYRRAVENLIRDVAQLRKTKQEQDEFVKALLDELAEEEKRWTEQAAPAPGPSGADLLLLRTTLEAESISKLRGRCKGVGLPEIPGAPKDVLVQVYLAYWVGTQRGAKDPP
jgi:superfamily I DNA/RNA helicase